MTDKSKNYTPLVIIIFGVLIGAILFFVVVRYAFEPSARPSAVRESTTQPVPFDAETREHVRDFVADEIDRQTGRSLQKFNALASAIITAVAILIAVAMAIFGFSWWRQAREHDKVIKEADDYRMTTKHSAGEAAKDAKRSKEYLKQIKKDRKQISNELKETKRLRESAKEAAGSAKASSRFAQALTYQNKGELDKAIEEYGRSIAAKEMPEAYNNRGNCWADKGEFDKAIADYTKAIELDPKNTFAYNNRGIAWTGKSEFGKAIEDFDKAIELDPKAPYYFNRGVAWTKKGEYDNAIADYDKAIELDPKDADYYSSRGIAWTKKGEYDKAIADFNKAIELDPKDADSYLNAAEALITLGQDFRGAVERLEQGRSLNVLESGEDRLGTHCLEGIALALNGDDASAAEAEAKRLLDGGAKASEWDTEPMERFLEGLKPEDFAPHALETARRIHEMLIQAAA